MTPTVMGLIATNSDLYSPYEVMMDGWATVSNGTMLARGLEISGNASFAGGTVSVLTNLLCVGCQEGGTGAMWITGGELIAPNSPTLIGNYSCSGQLTISNGTMLAAGVTVGGAPGARGTLAVAGGEIVAGGLLVGTLPCDGTGAVVATGGSVFVTNAAHSAVLEVRNGAFTVDGGMVVADTLVITNACGRFVHTGGSLVVGNLVLDPNLSAVGDGIPNGWKQQFGLDPLDPTVANADPDGDGMSNLQEYLAGTDPTNSASSFRITSLVQTGYDILVTWSSGVGKTNALQAMAGDAGGGYSDTFSDIFIVTNTVGTTTNHLDIGAVTNFPTRFYRVRLAP